MAQARFQIRVVGALDTEAREALGDLIVATEPTTTVLRGHLDQAALHGLLDRVRALGLELVDIRRASPGRSH